MQPRKFDSGARGFLNHPTGLTRVFLWFALPLTLFGCSQEGQSIDAKLQRSVVDASVFISEFHYDNLGADVDEGVEVSGIAGTDLREYTIVLYNGESGAPYRTFALSGVMPDEENGRGASVLALPSNGMQNGAADGIALVHHDPILGESVLEFLSYEGSFTATSGPAVGLTSLNVGVAETSSSAVGESLQLIPKGEIVVWKGPLPASFGKLNRGSDTDENEGNEPEDDSEAAILGACGDPSTPISKVQGPGSTSPLQGQLVELEGVVVGDFQGRAQLGGFFVQSESPDADPSTSEGVLVFEGEPTLEVTLGQRVRVIGKVSEYFGLTEVVMGKMRDCGEGRLPEAVALPLAPGDLAQLEALEGMRVTASDLVATETYNLSRYGEVTLSVAERLFNVNNGNARSAVDNATRRILLDDGREAQNQESIPYLATDKTLRLGDRLPHLDAILSFSFGAFRLHPLTIGNVTFIRDNPRTPVPADVGGDVRVASLNVLNYFTTLDERGANSLRELQRQRAKLVSTIVALNADVLGLIEVENNTATSGKPEALDNLVAAVNAALGKNVYSRAPDPQSTGSDAIRTALIYKPDVVSALDLTVSDEHPVHTRLPLAQAFFYRGNTFSVVVNHFKSKSSCPEDSSDPNADQGQGCWNALRTEQATALLGFVSQLKRATRSQDVIVLGDFNSYPLEDPITTLQAGGLIHQLGNLPEDEQYSYVFEGEAGVLDYAFTTPSLTVTGTTLWHINADEPRLLDYNTESNPPSAFKPDPFRSSDHDPVMIGLSWPSGPLNLMKALIETTESYANEARLDWRTRLQWTSLLRGAEMSLKRHLEAQAKRQRMASHLSPEVALRLKAFEAHVALHARFSTLSAAQAGDLRARSSALRELLGGAPG